MNKVLLNPFYVVQTKAGKNTNDINKIFGIPKGVPDEKWPKRENNYMHHLITIDVRKLTLPESIKADIITIFYYPVKKVDGKQPDPFEAVYLEFNDRYLKDLPRHPKEYNPQKTNNANNDVVTNGVQFDQQQIKEISQKQISESLVNQETSELPQPLAKLRGMNSFIGGFPMWLQEPNTPKAKDGSDAFYLFMLNGFTDYTKSTPFEGVDLFIFLDKTGKVYSVAQT